MPGRHGRRPGLSLPNRPPARRGKASIVVDERRARIFDDLRGLLDGELEFEPLDRAPYAIDGGLHEIDPLGVVAPRWEEDVVQLVRYAAENGIPLHPRGAGCDRSGGAIGPGLVVDLSRHFRKIEELDDNRVRAEAGVVLDELNRWLAPRGRRIQPVPVDSDVSTIGGLIAVDASGPNTPRLGSFGDHVERVRTVLSQAELVDLGFMPWPEYEAEPATFLELVVKKLHAIHRASQSRLEKVAADCPWNRAGYALIKAADAQGVQLARLATGSEGTLAIVTAAVLRTSRVPACVGVAVASFGRLTEALAYAAACADPALAASSVLVHDRRTIRLACDLSPFFRDWLEPATEAAVIVAFEADSPEQIAYGLAQAHSLSSRRPTLESPPAATQKRADCDRILALAKLVEPLLMRPRTRARPVPFLDDVAVPRQQLANVSRQLRDLFQRWNVTWTLTATGDGKLQFRPYLDLSLPSDRALLEPLAAEAYEIVLKAGGTISSAQACGLVRTPFLRSQFGELMSVIHEIKNAFDPLNIFNPGKVAPQETRRITGDLRSRVAPAHPPDSVLSSSSSSSTEVPALPASGSLMLDPIPAQHPSEPSAQPTIKGALRWPQLSLIEMASACNGCGACRSLDQTLRMCPSFRATRREPASPRAQANLIRQIAAGLVDPRSWDAEELRQRADLCLHCQLCEAECPSAVDVSSLMLEAKAAYVENHGLSFTDWIFSRIEFWAKLGTRLPNLTNLLLHHTAPRWLLDRLLGLSSRRILPRVSRTSFLERAIRRGLTKPRPQIPGARVAYFIDVFANYYDQDLAESVLSVLRHAGVNVYVPRRQRASGMSALIVGDLEHARELALRNIRELATAVRDGYTIICSEPTAALMLRSHYARLTEDLDAELVANNTMDVGQYLLGLEQRGQLPKPTSPFEARVGYHQPCHLRALGVGMPGFDLLRKVLGLDVAFIDRGCSGMGATYGLARDRFWLSRRAGRGLVKRLRDHDIEIGSTECGACRIQMEQGVTKRTLHPLKLLALGYGLNPKLRATLKDPKPRNQMA